MKKTLIVFATTTVMTAGILAQQRTGAPPPSPKQGTGAPAKPAAKPVPSLTASVKATYENYKKDLTQSAELMKEADYSFKPAGVAAEVRTFGQIVGHVADANAMFCSAAAGTPPPAPKDVEHARSKADIQKGLAESFAICDKAFADTTNANASTAVTLPFGLGDNTRLGTLAFNTSHISEHYGNLVTYFRAKGMVPPSSAPQPGRGRE